MDRPGTDLYFRAMAALDRPETPYAPPPQGLWIDELRFPPRLWTWRARGTPDCLLMVGTSGVGWLRHPQGERRCLPGEALLLLPGAVHDYGAREEPWVVRWAHFPLSAALGPHLRWPALGGGIHHLVLPPPRLPAIAAALHRGRAYLRGAAPLRVALAQTALHEALLLLDQANPARGTIDPRVQHAIEVLVDRLHQPLRLLSVARAVGLSPSRLSRLFHAQTGATVRTWLERRRLELACSRLELTDEPIGRIADSLGFTSAFYFSRRFHRHAGMSPRRWRTRARTRGEA